MYTSLYKNQIALKNILFILPVLAHLLQACGSSEPPAGGPCTYEYKQYPAVIFQIQNENENNVKVSYYSWQDGQKNDTVWYTESNNRSWSKKTIAARNIKIGDTCTLLVGEIQTGSCNPHIKSFSIDKWKVNNSGPKQNQSK